MQGNGQTKGLRARRLTNASCAHGAVRGYKITEVVRRTAGAEPGMPLGLTMEACDRHAEEFRARTK